MSVYEEVRENDTGVGLENHQNNTTEGNLGDNRENGGEIMNQNISSLFNDNR